MKTINLLLSESFQHFPQSPPVGHINTTPSTISITFYPHQHHQQVKNNNQTYIQPLNNHQPTNNNHPTIHHTSNTTQPSNTSINHYIHIISTHTNHLTIYKPKQHQSDHKQLIQTPTSHQTTLHTTTITYIKQQLTTITHPTQHSLILIKHTQSSISSHPTLS